MRCDGYGHGGSCGHWNCDSGDRNFSADWRTVASQRGDGCALEFLDAVLGVVIGVEFLKMLCKPNTANIIEA